jgi:16S rRNA (guanine1207-N2)-methyltransferase
MELPPQGAVLDLGCGYGPIGIAAATINPDVHVVMVDVNERAVRLARKNAQRNNVTNVAVRSGWLYQPIGNTKFEAVLSNPPLSAGKPTVSSIVGEAPSHLRDNGSLQVVVRSKTGGPSLLREMDATFGNVKVVARKSGYRVLLAKKP